MFIWKPTNMFCNSKYSQGWLPDEHNQLDTLYFSASNKIEIIKIVEMFLSHKSIFLSGITMNLINSQISTIQDMFTI